MHISKLNIENFRNIKNLSISLHPKFNLISGINGSGKTSIIEAIYFLSIGRSFRCLQLNKIISHQEKSFTVYADYKKEGIESSIAIKRLLNGNSINKINSIVQDKHLNLTYELPVQLFNPESFSIINDGAKERCKILDWGVFYNDKNFIKVWQKYKYLIKIRNASLKKSYPKGFIDKIDEMLFPCAQSLDNLRFSYFNLLKPIVFNIFNEFTKNIPLEIEYYRGWNTKKSLPEIYEEHYNQETQSGITAYGPHRADLRFKINGHPSQHILSRGQQKLLICAIKTAQGILFNSQHTTNQCTYLFDDLHSELDNHTLAYIIDTIKKTNSQIIATSINHKYISSMLDCDHKHLNIDNGKIIF